MNLLYVVTGQPKPELARVFSSARDLGHHVSIVGDEAASAAHPEESIDVPGHGWLPFDVVELDAVSYLAKKDIEFVFAANALGKEGLERTFCDGAKARGIPFLVLRDDDETSLSELTTT